MKTADWILGNCRFAAPQEFPTIGGRPFWIAAVDAETGEIKEAHTYEEAKESDFNHSLYFGDDAVGNIASGRWGAIWWEKSEHKFMFEMFSRARDRNVDKDFVLGAVLSQVQLPPRESPPPYALPAKPRKVKEHEPQHSMDPGTGDDDGW